MTASVTIGIPVYNGADTLRRAVESAVAQTHPVDMIYISDNASTDATPEIGRALAAEYGPRVVFTRQETSLGMSGNFGHVLHAAQTDYFMWLAADDWIAPTYVERTLTELEADPTLVACVSRVAFQHPDGTTQPVGGTYPLLADTVTNLASYLAGPSDNSRIFGLYRTHVLLKVFPPRYFHAYDWSVAAGTLLYGRHMELPETLMVRDETPSVAYIRGAHRDFSTTLGRLFPAAAMTVDLVRRHRIPLRWPIIKSLLRINLELHLNYALHYYPRYGKAVEPFLRRYVLWRLDSPRPPLPTPPARPVTGTAC